MFSSKVLSCVPRPLVAVAHDALEPQADNISRLRTTCNLELVGVTVRICMIWPGLILFFIFADRILSLLPIDNIDQYSSDPAGHADMPIIF